MDHKHLKIISSFCHKVIKYLVLTKHNETISIYLTCKFLGFFSLINVKPKKRHIYYSSVVE